MLKIGIVGIGTIGQTITCALENKKISAQAVAFTDLDVKKAENFAKTLNNPPPIVDLDTLIQCSDLVVETASQAAVAQVVPKALNQGKDLMILSVGGLLGHEAWFSLAEEKKCRIYVPSGAIAGLDGLKAATFGKIETVTLTSRKPVQALRHAPYVVEQGIDLDALTQEKVILEGPALMACRVFPATANVAASLSLAGIGPEKTWVKIIAVPGGLQNVHEITVKGTFGTMKISVENIPSETNPKTSRLAAFSALATLAGITRSVKIGT